ncbi:outer membrane protein assembly factor BamA [Pelagibacteraceae bacterium]|nr:outer membrane protein assembly factor BamA [Pelagibacteraceae bacterium]
MKKLKINYDILKFKLLIILFLLFFSKTVFSSEVLFEIQGNDFTDTNAILSLLNEIPVNPNKEDTNDIINVLNNSNLFSDVKVQIINKKILIIVKEYPNIDRIYFNNNKRFQDDELKLVASQINLDKSNTKSINLFINELTKLYESFGYNNVQINFEEQKYEKTNTVDLYFDINEGSITKINKIIINSNNKILDQEIREIIKSKTKTIRNILANNNFKPEVVERDKYIISNYFKNFGYLDVIIETNIEYLENNRVNIYFYIEEGAQYFISEINIDDNKNIINSSTIELINSEINIFLEQEKKFSNIKIRGLEKKLASIILENGLDYFEINSLEKKENNNVKILFQILPIIPKYTNQINIVGNSRTFDHVIRRELKIIEGDAIYESQIKNIKDKLTSLNLFKSVNLRQEEIDENKINLIIEVEEKQTGTFNAGISVGTLDGFAIVTGLRERNFYGTGRSLDVLVNTSEDKNQFKLITTDRLSYENDADISYSINYKQEDFSNASSYKLDTFSSGIGIGYKVNQNLYHNIDLEYVLKDYKVTDSSTVSNTILSSSGSNISYLIKNNLRYSTLNSGFISKTGNYFNFNNTLETPTSSNNGFARNIINVKKFFNTNNSIYSIQGKFGNIFSLNNKDILTDDKFSLGGRWLRGFDNYGAGPRNSRTSYIGGNNIAVIKFDYSYELTKQSNFPFYFNIFNDYGLIWDNKTTPTHSDENVRSSAGFGIKYYSPVGPIGLTWGFPIVEEEYDIKRMFLFSIGNLD